MKLALLCWLALALAAAADWPQELTREPGQFPPLRPFQARYRFGWNSLTAAEATLEHTVDRARNTAQLHTEARSTGMVRALWRMDARQTASLALPGFQPLGLTQTETYRDEAIMTTLQFTPEGVSRLRQSIPPPKNPAKTKRFKFPAVYDLFAAVEFVRSQRLGPGERCKLVVYPSSAPYLAEITSEGKTNIKIGDRPSAVIKLDLKIWKVQKNLQLDAHDKVRRCTAYLSDDNERMLLRVEGEIHVGTVWGELESITWLDQPPRGQPATSGNPR